MSAFTKGVHNIRYARATTITKTMKSAILVLIVLVKSPLVLEFRVATRARKAFWMKRNCIQYISLKSSEASIETIGGGAGGSGLTGTGIVPFAVVFYVGVEFVAGATLV